MELMALSLSDSFASLSAGSSRQNPPHMGRREMLPDDLLALAHSPMAKGKGAGVPDEWSVTGNFAVVSRARELVASVVLHGNALHKEW